MFSAWFSQYVNGDLELKSIKSMVTGIETAGLVLATVPLLISALEHYRDGVRTIVRLTRTKSLVKKLRSSLEVQRVRQVIPTISIRWPRCLFCSKSSPHNLASVNKICPKNALNAPLWAFQRFQGCLSRRYNGHPFTIDGNIAD